MALRIPAKFGESGGKTMKKWKLLPLWAALCLALGACARGETLPTEPRPSAAMLTLDETVEPPEKPLPPPEKAVLYEGSIIRYDGRTYRYRAPDSPTDARELYRAGCLTFSPEIWETLTTNREELEGCVIYHLAGGKLTEDALLLTDPEGRGHLFYPEGYFEGYEKDFQFTEDGQGGAVILKYRGCGDHVQVPEELGGLPVRALGTEGVEGVFASCPTVVSVTVPQGVRSLGEDAFYGCPRLEEVRLPESLERIGSCAFHDCPALEDLYFSGSAPKAGNCLFDEEVPPALYLHIPRGTAGWAGEPWSRFPRTEE